MIVKITIETDDPDHGWTVSRTEAGREWVVREHDEGHTHHVTTDPSLFAATKFALAEAI